MTTAVASAKDEQERSVVRILAGWVDEVALAQEFAKHPKTVRKIMLRAGVAHRKLGATHFYKILDIQQFMETGSVVPEAESTPARGRQSARRPA